MLWRHFTRVQIIRGKSLRVGSAHSNSDLYHESWFTTPIYIIPFIPYPGEPSLRYHRDCLNDNSRFYWILFHRFYRYHLRYFRINIFFKILIWILILLLHIIIKRKSVSINYCNRTIIIILVNIQLFKNLCPKIRSLIYDSLHIYLRVILYTSFFLKDK